MDNLTGVKGSLYTRKGFERSIYVFERFSNGKIQLLEILDGKRTFKRQFSPKVWRKEFSDYNPTPQKQEKDKDNA